MIIMTVWCKLFFIILIIKYCVFIIYYKNIYFQGVYFIFSYVLYFIQFISETFLLFVPNDVYKQKEEKEIIKDDNNDEYGDRYNTKIAQIKEVLNNERLKNKKVIDQLTKEIDDEEETNINLNKKIDSLTKELEEEKEAKENLNQKINNLMNELLVEKENNKQLNIKINRLAHELDEEKEANYNLLKKIKKLTSILDEEKMNNKHINEKLKTYETSANKNLNKMKELYDEIDEKEKKIDRLRIKLSRFPFELATGERLMSIIVISSDRRILYSIICKNTDTFTKIEDELYDQFPQYRKYDIYFRHNGKKINRHISLEENKIYNNDIINLEID